MKKRVEFFLIGAQKAGTTSLYDWLGQHPEVSAPHEIKDYHFFSDEDLYKKGSDHFESFYQESQSVKVHAAVNYLYFYEMAAKRLYDYNPQAKVIICLREPVSRALSAYKYCLKTLREDKKLSEALKAELQGELLTYKQLADNTYIGHSQYPKQINEFEKYFFDNVHYVLFENLVDVEKRPDEIKRVLDFMKVKQVNFQFNYRHLNKSGQPRSKALNSLLRDSSLQRFASILLPRKFRKKVRSIVDELNTSSKDIEMNVSLEDIEIIRNELDFSYENLIRKVRMNIPSA